MTWTTVEPVRISGTLHSRVPSNRAERGLRRGDELSCLLFNIVLEGVIQRAGINTRGTIITKTVQLLGFADGSKENPSLLPRGTVKVVDVDEVVDEFVYLGSLVTADNDSSEEI